MLSAREKDFSAREKVRSGGCQQTSPGAAGIGSFKRSESRGSHAEFYSDACNTNETLIDVRSHDVGLRRRTNNWHEGNANSIIHRIRCDIREIGEFWNAVGNGAPVETKSSRKFDRLIRCRGRPASRRCCSGIPEMRLNAGRKRVSGCAWAVRGFDPSDGRARRALESGGHENDEHNRHDRPTHRFARTGGACFSPGDRTAPSSS